MQLDDASNDEVWVDEILHDDFVFAVGARRFEGKDAIRSLNEARAEGPPRGTHILSEPVIEFADDADRAVVVTAYVYFSAAEGGGYQATTVGQYTDEFVRGEGGDWRVLSRTNVHLGPR
jgi:hypothetical protein